MPPAAMAMMKNRGMTSPLLLRFERAATAQGCECCRYGIRRIAKISARFGPLVDEVRKPPASADGVGHPMPLRSSGDEAMQSPGDSRRYATVSADRQKELNGLEFFQALAVGT